MEKLSPGRLNEMGLATYCLALFKSVMIFPSRPSFLTRGDQGASLCPPFPLVNSSTYTSPRCTATPVGDQGRSALRMLSTTPFGEIFRTVCHPVPAAYT